MTLTPLMSLNVPTIGIDSGLTWENALNANSSILDGHNHSPGSGSPISASGILIDSDLSFNGFNLTTLRSSRYAIQLVPIAASGSDLGCLYVSGVDLYYNDVNGNQIQITSGGLVNATSSGISSGTASASFSSSVLVVNAASNTPANIKCASIVMGNTGVSGGHYLTLSPPAALAANYNLVFPSIPAQTNVMSLDTSGTMASITYDAVGQGMTSVGANAIAASTSNPNFGGKAAKENSKNLVVSNTNATNSLALIRGRCDGSSGITSGEGWSLVHNATGQWTVTFSTAFGDTPTVVVGLASNSSIVGGVTAENAATTGFQVAANNGAAFSDIAWSFIAIGQRA